MYLLGTSPSLKVQQGKQYYWWYPPRKSQKICGQFRNLSDIFGHFGNFVQVCGLLGGISGCSLDIFGKKS